MKLSDQQCAQFERDGYVAVPGLFDGSEIALLNRALDTYLATPKPQIHLQRRGSETARLAFGADKESDAFDRLVHHPRWILPAKQLLGDEIYMHQLRINPKAPFDGESFWWHQDYGTWRLEDGMPTPRALMLGIYLDDVTPANGPLLVIPGSQRHGAVDEISPDRNSGGYTVADIDRPAVEKLVAEHGIEALTFPAGTAVFIHCNLVHASPENLTPKRRTIVYLNANAVSNRITKLVRAEHHANRDFKPLVPLNDDCLRQIA